jgi:catechol 2,3-dioxygenase-like lactoylglutathione lyase family enzyme
MSAGSPGPFAGVLEACLYHSAAEAEAIEEFYVGKLGLPVVSRWRGALAMRVGSGVLLVFEREALAERESPIAAHGADGPGHVCLLAAGAADYEPWRDRVAELGIEITHEQEWDGRRRSFYFCDPAGNLIEIADGDLWPAR